MCQIHGKNRSEQQKKPFISERLFFRRDGQIRTDDLHIPNVARYRATLHPEVLQKHYYKCCYKMRVQRYNFFDSKKENPIFFK